MHPDLGYKVSGWLTLFAVITVMSHLSSIIMACPTDTPTFRGSRDELRVTKDNITHNKNLQIKTQAPVIGILTQVLRDYKRLVPTRHLHLVASYVKWIEMTGAKVLPILLNQDEAYYERVFAQTNGLLFPGGDNLLDPDRDTPMMVAAKKLYRLAMEANQRGDFYPIWGTCLGMELLTVLSSGKNALAECLANDMAIPVQMRQRGNLFSPSVRVVPWLEGVDYPGKVAEIMSTNGASYNYHHFCVTDKTLEQTHLQQFYRPLAYSNDSLGVEFVTIMEAVEYPFFGVQFHPEKPPFEFVIKSGQVNVPHSGASMTVSRYLADFFASQARLNGHQVATKTVASELIYAHQPMYTAPLGDMYEQRYLFPFKNNGLDTSEFLDYLPADDESAPEYSGSSRIDLGDKRVKSATGT